MKTFRRHAPTINTGSMADIAFLLLLFFLVSTTISAEKGILRQLPPPCPPGSECNSTTADRNLLQVFINDHNDILINDDIVSLTEVSERVKAFIDNNGRTNCSYCSGSSSSLSSDHPNKAVISLGHGAFTTYEVFIALQDEITKAYYDLRAGYAMKVYNKTPQQLTQQELAAVKQAYPLLLSEVKVKR